MLPSPALRGRVAADDATVAALEGRMERAFRIESGVATW
jgi:hypothetical protein